MPERNEIQLLLDIFVKLTECWEVELTPVQIGCDLEKIELMERVNRALINEPVVIPDKVLQLYSKVYLRDVWRTKPSNKSSK